MRKAVITAAIAIMILEIISTLPVGLTEAMDDRRDVLEHEIRTGQTREFGGGDFILVDLGSSMSFGLVHGNEVVNSPITIFSRGTEILGFHKDRDGRGPLLKNTYTAYTLTRLTEFNDTNNNGRLDLLPVPSDDTMEKDRIVKHVDLSRKWTSTRPIKREGANGYSWDFSLYSRNASYSRQEKNDGASTYVTSSDNVLELVRFDFRISLNRERKLEILYTYTSEEIGGDIRKANREQTELEGARLLWKMDHRILGWDFDESNKNAALMLGFNLRFATSYNSLLSAESDLPDREGGIITIPLKGGRFPIWKERDQMLSKIAENDLDGGEISIGDRDWTSRLFWDPMLSRTPSVTAMQNHARLNLYRYSLIGPRSEIWDNTAFVSGRGTGVVISGGYTYPSLRMIVHDPGLETVGYRTPVLEMEMQDGHGVILDTILENTTATILISLLMIIVGIGIAAVLTLSRKSLNYHDPELKHEHEAEIFDTGRKKRDWDSLKVK